MNYEIFFELKDKPFRQGPDIDYFYSSNIHKELMHHLYYCIDSDDAFVEITGEPGIGKTITVRSFLNQIAGEKVKLSLIVNPKITPQDLLSTIALDCGMDEDIIENNSGEKLFRMFHDHLKQLSHQEIVPIVVIDEAHSLSNEALEYLCLISNLEIKKKHLIKIILLGQPFLRQRLQDPVLKQIDNRITIRFCLTPMSKHDMASYIYHRLSIASGSESAPSLFSEQIIHQIYRYSQGVPRIVNVLCDRTLMAAFLENSREITSVHVKKAYKSFQDKERTASHIKKKRFLVVSVALLFFWVCIYAITSLISDSHTSETNSIPIQTDPLTQHSDSVEEHALPITQTEITMNPKISESKTTPETKTTEPSIIMTEKTNNQLIQKGNHVNQNKIPIESIFTNNSYCIVVSPDTHRMVVWQGMPDFTGLTSTHSESFPLQEGMYLMNKNTNVVKTYTGVAAPISMTYQDSAEPIINSADLTMTHEIISEPIVNAEDLTKSHIVERSNNLAITHDVSLLGDTQPLTANNTRQLQSAKQFDRITDTDIKEVQTVDIKSDSDKPKAQKQDLPKSSSDTLSQNTKTRPLKNNALLPKEKKHALQQKAEDPNQKRQMKPEKEIIEKQIPLLQEVISLPADKRMAMISLDVKQLTVWKGTDNSPKLIKQATMDIVLPEGIYILSKNNNKPFLFHPDDIKQLSDKLADELWKKIDPITNVISVIVRQSNKKSYGSHTRQLLSFINQWESAWHQKNLDNYMQMYLKDIIYFYKLNAPAIKLNWKILKSSQSRIFAGNRQKMMQISPVTYLVDPNNSNLAVAIFNQTFSDANYSEIGVMVFYLKYMTDDSKQKNWFIYGRLRIY